MRTLAASRADEDCRDSQPIVRAQSNVDFVIALFIMLVFFSAILFVPGSPLVEASQSSGDERIDAQRVTAELTSQVGEPNGQLDIDQIEAIVDGEEDLDDYTTTEDDVGVAIVLYPAPAAFYSSSSLFDGVDSRQAGDTRPESDAGTSYARKMVRIDNRTVVLEVFVWREA